MAGLHNRKVMAGLALCMLVLTGCNTTKTPEATSLIIDKDGTVTSHMVDVFDKQYYDLDELRKAAQEQVADYNTDYQVGDVAAVTLQQVEALPGDDSQIIVTYIFDSAETYEACSENIFFYGTVEEAIQAGYHFGTMNQVLFDTKGDKSIVSGELENMGQKHVILLAEQTRVYSPYKVAYISEDARALEDGSIDTTGVPAGEYPVIIMLEK